MEKSDLKPGTRVRHKKTGRVGEVSDRSKGELSICADCRDDSCVSVLSRVESGENIGRYDHLTWNIANMELAPG